MWMLLGAVVSASVLGSMHCVGMCGPLAMWASGSGEQVSSGRVAKSLSLYHFGRLITYASVGAVAGGLGSLLDLGAQTLGWQLLAARVAGTLMVGIGLIQIWKFLASRNLLKSAVKAGSLQPGVVTTLLVKLRPYIFRLPLEVRGALTGALTAFLPCGWLYLFALVAAGSASVLGGTLVMIAFWLGTVPALTALVAGAQRISTNFRQVFPVATALLLIAAGSFTFAGRGFAKLNSLSDLAASLPTIGSESLEGQESPNTQELVSQLNRAVSEGELPCCCEGNSAEDSDQHSP